MIRTNRKLVAFFLSIFTIAALSASSIRAQEVAAPDLSVCLNNGYEGLESSLGFTFANQQDCLFFAALGGTFGNSNGATEADFFITNLTSRNLQLTHIQYNRAANVTGITVGVPGQWPSGTLPAPSASPNWLVNTTLKLRFFYNTPLVQAHPVVDWVLHVSDGGALTFNASGRKDPGWAITCSGIDIIDICVIGADTAHALLIEPPPFLFGSGGAH
jgi:hypothetical protein